MKRLAAALLATTCLVMPTAARAEPITIALAATVGVELIAGSTAAAVATFALTTTVGIGLSLAASALLAKPSALAADTSSGGADLSVSYGAAQPRSAIMGPGATGGHHVYTNVYGSLNEWMECVFVIGDGRHGKITALKYNGKDCTLPSGGLAAGSTYAVPEFNFAGTPLVGLTYYDGRYDQAADANLIANSNPPGRWTTDHRGRGVAYLVIHQLYGEGEFNTTSVPQLMIETEGLLLYDPRKDDTNGGSGPHRWGLPETYEPSANPAVQEYNFRRGILVNGQRVLGMSMSPVNLILQMYFTAMNDNDFPIPLAEGGTEPRYRCSITISDDRAASDVLSSLRAATAGWSLERGGQFGPVSGLPQVPIASLAFTDDDMIVGASASFTKYRSRSEIVTATFGQFSDPAQFWVSAAFPPRENAADDAAMGERIAKSLDLTQVYSSSQAQRIAESERRKTLQQGQGMATLPAKWIGVQPGDWLPFNSARHGNMTVMVTGTTLDTARQQITISFERTSNTVYSWTTAGELFPPEVGTGGQVGTLIMIAAGMTATGVTVLGDGGLKTPGIHFTWTPIFDPTVEQIDFEIRKVGDSVVLPFTAEFPTSGSAICSGHGIAAATTYEYRHKLYTVPARDTPWSAWALVISGTEHVVPSALSSVPIDEVTLAMFEAGLEQYVGTELAQTFKEVSGIEQLIASLTTEQEAQNRLELHLQKDADIAITGQVSTLTGGATWRGEWNATALYHAGDMVTLAGKLYVTTADVHGTSPPAAPWAEQFTAAFVSNEWRTFAGPDGVAAQTSSKIEARFSGATQPDGTVNDMPQSLAQVSSVWNAFAGSYGASSSSVQQLVAAINGDSATIEGRSTVAANINGQLIATWQVTADVNGYVSGIKLYNTGSTAWFVVQTDYFLVVKPGAAGGTPVPVFEINAVSTVPKIVFRGDMFADGTITARTINAGSIQAVHVGANEIIANTLNVKNLILDNVHIRGAAITSPGFAAGGAVTLGSGAGEQTLASFSIPYRGVAGSAVIIQAQASAIWTPLSAGGNGFVRLYIGGVMVMGYDVTGNNTTFPSLTGARSVTASGGNETITVLATGATYAGAPAAVGSANVFGCAYLR